MHIVLTYLIVRSSALSIGCMESSMQTFAVFLIQNTIPVQSGIQNALSAIVGFGHSEEQARIRLCSHSIVPNAQERGL